MKKGKISQNQWNRSVGKKILYRSDRLVERAAAGRDTAGYRFLPDFAVCTTIQTEKGPVALLGKKAFYRMYNALAASGAAVDSILVQLLLPECATESEIKAVMEQLGRYTAAYKTAMGVVQVEVSTEVNAPLLALSGIGKKTGQEENNSAFQPGQQIVMTKWAGAFGAAELSYLWKESLVQKFPAVYIEEVNAYLTEKAGGESLLSIERESEIARQFGARAFHAVSKNGVFGALWEMAELSGTGLRVDLEAIPVRQESIEICEQYDGNPYEMDSLGCLIIGTEMGEELVRLLRQKDIPAAVIGQVTEGNDRVIRRGGETRFLTPP